MSIEDNPAHPMHGRPSGYHYYRCRCDRCRKWKAAEVKRAFEDRLTRPSPNWVHGTYSGYKNWRCRCDACRDAGSVYNARYYAHAKTQRG